MGSLHCRGTPGSGQTGPRRGGTAERARGQRGGADAQPLGAPPAGRSAGRAGTAGGRARAHGGRRRLDRRARRGGLPRCATIRACGWSATSAPRAWRGRAIAGIADARAPWVAFLDDDDLWSPLKLRSQFDAVGCGRGRLRLCGGRLRGRRGSRCGPTRRRSPEPWRMLCAPRTSSAGRRRCMARDRPRCDGWADSSRRCRCWPTGTSGCASPRWAGRSRAPTCWSPTASTTTTCPAANAPGVRRA